MQLHGIKFTKGFYSCKPPKLDTVQVKVEPSPEPEVIISNRPLDDHHSQVVPDVQRQKRKASNAADTYAPSTAKFATPGGSATHPPVLFTAGATMSENQGYQPFKKARTLLSFFQSREDLASKIRQADPRDSLLLSLPGPDPPPLIYRGSTAPEPLPIPAPVSEGQLRRPHQPGPEIVPRVYEVDSEIGLGEGSMPDASKSGEFLSVRTRKRCSKRTYSCSRSKV